MHQDDYRYASDKLSMFSRKYYLTCAAGGMLSAGTTHLLITPLDMLKVNMQVNPTKYSSIWSGLSLIFKEQGPSGLWRGWGGKLFGYGAQGGCRFGLYEYFKKLYCDSASLSNIKDQRTLVYLAASASAQVIADVALCPFEAVKVQVQTQSRFAKGLADGFPRMYKTEGFSGFYKGIIPLWGRNLPFAMIMFSTFEHSVDFLYKHIAHKQRIECSAIQQLGITCAAGYMSGAIGAIFSNPADNIVSYLYNNRAKSVSQAVKHIGLANLCTRSLSVRIAIVGPVITLQWFFYDLMKVFCGLPTSGGMDHCSEQF